MTVHVRWSIDNKHKVEEHQQERNERSNMTQGWQRVALYEYLTVSSLRVDLDINELSLLSRCLAWPGLEIAFPMIIGSV